MESEKAARQKQTNGRPVGPGNSFSDAELGWASLTHKGGRSVGRVSVHSLDGGCTFVGSRVFPLKREVDTGQPHGGVWWPSGGSRNRCQNGARSGQACKEGCGASLEQKTA